MYSDHMYSFMLSYTVLRRSCTTLPPAFHAVQAANALDELPIRLPGSGLDQRLLCCRDGTVNASCTEHLLLQGYRYDLKTTRPQERNNARAPPLLHQPYRGIALPSRSVNGYHLFTIHGCCRSFSQNQRSFCPPPHHHHRHVLYCALFENYLRLTQCCPRISCYARVVP